MNLFTLPVVLAVFALAYAAPKHIGKHDPMENDMPVAVMSTTISSNEPLEFDCSDKHDGGYVIGCSQVFFLCSKRVMTKAICPDGMIFDQDIKRCHFHISKCSGVHTTIPFGETLTFAQIDVNFDCSNLIDGDYQYADCQVKYVSCVAGQAIQRTCPDAPELRFDPLRDRCERIADIEACGGFHTPVEVVVHEEHKLMPTTLADEPIIIATFRSNIINACTVSVVGGGQDDHIKEIGPVAIKTAHGAYLRPRSGQSGWVDEMAGPPGEWSGITILEYPDGKVAFKTADGTWLHPDADGKLDTQSDADGSEKFEVIRVNGKYAFRSIYGKFVFADKDDLIKVNQDEITDWALFDLECLVCKHAC